MLTLIENTDDDEHQKELHYKLADLENFHAKLFRRYGQQLEVARQCYKDILKGEKHLQCLQKEQDAIEAKCSKLRKQVSSLCKPLSFFQSLEICREPKIATNVQPNEQEKAAFFSVLSGRNCEKEERQRPSG